MEIELNYKNAIANRGNLTRIKEVMKRARVGEALTVGFLGGSITQGSLATKPTLCYAYHVYEWWCRKFPKAAFTYINAGIGATNSQFGCVRAENDLLRYEPDMVFIEFSVNDISTPHFLETYEGLVREIYASGKKPAVMLIHNVCYDNGANAQLMHGKIARYYNLPSVSMQSSIYPELVAGRIENRDITPDDLHPNDKGHALVASVITYFLDKISKELDEEEMPDMTVLPHPMTENAYQDSIRYQNTNSTPKLLGFVKDEAVQEGITDIFKNGWTASDKGAKIEFDIEGSCIGVQYRKTILLPAPVAKLTVDGDEEHTFLLDANFEETWGDKLELDTVLEHGKKGMHHIVIELVETHVDDKLPFYLASFIGSGR
ncbi:MAG: SGNH/GDSL hydrolase family protein [Agathobacter sp.]